MAVADPARCRLRMTDAELAAVAALGRSGPAAEPESRQLLVDALAAAGVLTSGTAPAWVDDLLRGIAQPALRAVVETVTVGAPVVHRLWVNPLGAVLGAPVAEGVTELSWLDPVTTPYAIAQLLQFRRRPPPPAGTAPVRLPASRMAEIEKSLVASDAAGGGAPPAGQPAGGGGWTGRDAETVGGIIRQRRLTWRVSSVWADGPDRRRTASLSVIDAGAAGLWALTVHEPDSQDPMLQLEAVAASTVWHRLVALLPVSDVSGTEVPG